MLLSCLGIGLGDSLKVGRECKHWFGDNEGNLVRAPLEDVHAQNIDIGNNGVPVEITI